MNNLFPLCYEAERNILLSKEEEEENSDKKINAVGTERSNMLTIDFFILGTRIGLT